MTAPEYASADVFGKGYLLKLDDLGGYRAIAEGEPNAMREIAGELNEHEERRGREAGAECVAAVDKWAGEHGLAPRETQLDALVDRADTDRPHELHADRRRDLPYLGGPGFGRRAGYLPPDGTVPGR